MDLRKSIDFQFAQPFSCEDRADDFHGLDMLDQIPEVSVFTF